MNSISPTQSNIQAAVLAFLFNVLPPLGSDGLPVDALAAVANRVPETKSTDFVLMTAHRIDRLETNLDDYADVKFTASIAPAAASFTGSIGADPVTRVPTLTVSAMGSGYIGVGSAISGTGVAPNTIVTGQLTGTPGGVGTYAVSIGQTVQPTTIAATYGVMTVSAVQLGSIAAGAMVFGTGVTAGTKVGGQLTGTVGGIGTYSVSPSQTLSSTTLSTGSKSVTQGAMFAVQLDFHSADNTASDMAQTVSTLFRDEYATDFFSGLSAPLNQVVPLHADDPHYTPFVNDQGQYEWRWVVDAYVEADQVTTVPQQFVDEVQVTPVSVVATFPA